MSTSQNMQKKAKTCAISWTIIYSLLFPIFVYFALLSTMVFDSSGLSTPKGLFIIFSISLIPLSLSLSIDLMWSNYLGEEYSKTLTFSKIPWLIFIFVFLLNVIIN